MSNNIRNLQIIQTQQWVLILTGLWPIEQQTISYKFRQLITFTLSTLLTMTILIQIYYTIGDFKELSQILFMGSTVIAYIIKLYCFRMNFKICQQLLEDIENLNDWIDDNDCDYHLQQPYLISKYLTIGYLSVCSIASTTYAIFPLVENQPLPLPFPFFNDGHLHYPMFFIQWICIIYTAWVNIGIDSLTVGFMLIIGGHFDILKQRIEFCINNNQIIDEEQLKNCCIYHNKIIKITERVQRLFVVGLFAQFCSSAICICNTGFQFLLITWKSIQFIGLLLFFLAMLAQLSMYCWFGNEIIVKSRQVSDACYNSQWYQLDAKLIKYVFLIMERCKRPIVIDVYNLATLSLTSFVSILHWSYSYFALLRQLYQKITN